MENKVNKLYPCPCCGYLTLESQSPDTYLFCPICFWVDQGENFNWIGNCQISLRQAQLNFLEFGACDQEWLHYVRRPTENDIRDSNWQPLEEKLENMRLKLIENIYQVFNNISLEDGISLQGAKALDDYHTMEEAREISRKTASQEKWQDISQEFIEKWGHYFGFLDPKGFRYYLPALMIYSLNENGGYGFIDSMYFALSHDSKSYKKHLALLTQEQLEVTEEYIKFMELRFDTP